MRSQAVVLRHPDYDRPILLCVQSLSLNLREQIRRQRQRAFSFSHLWRRLLARSPVDVLVLGQLLTSGPFGGSGLEQLSPHATAELLDALGRYLIRGKRFAGVVVKDLLPSAHPAEVLLRDRGFTSVGVDPVMLLHLDRFTDFSDYLAALSSKYRVRYRRARSKGEGLNRRLLKGEALKASLPTIYELHLETRRGADVSFVELSLDYFAWLRDRAEFHGYYDGETLVGFTTAIISGDYLHAHYLGLREPYKYSHHLYHNMLFDLLQDALLHSVSVLDFGRTALEIKSSLGAEGHAYGVLATSRFRWFNPILERLLRYVHTPESWVPRNPLR